MMSRQRSVSARDLCRVRARTTSWKSMISATVGDHDAKIVERQVRSRQV
jgi:hypothetical protein